MGKCISFHSYKGGTGKTTLASNFSYLLASKGYTVYLLDLDFYAPSLHSYFDVEPKFWINDYLKNQASIDEILLDTNFLSKNTMAGQLLIGCSKGGKEDISQLEGNLINDREQQLNLFRNFISLREELLVNKDADFVIMDTSPGIRYWSINSVVISDIVLLTLKMGDLDLKGTIKMIDEIYGSLLEYGSVFKILLNRVPGYCIPFSGSKHLSSDLINDSSFKEKIEISLTGLKNGAFKANTLAEIPCYCDIQFKEREFLTTNYFPDHPFTGKINDLVKSVEEML